MDAIDPSTWTLLAIVLIANVLVLYVVGKIVLHGTERRLARMCEILDRRLPRS